MLRIIDDCTTAEGKFLVVFMLVITTVMAALGVVLVYHSIPEDVRGDYYISSSGRSVPSVCQHVYHGGDDCIEAHGMTAPEIADMVIKLNGAMR